jgi:signal transduction histidine kinase
MRFTFAFHFALVWSICTAQTASKIDTLKRELLTVKADTSRMQIMLELRAQYDLVNVDSTLHYGQQALSLAHQIRNSQGEVRALYAVGSAYRRMGEIPKGLEFIYKGLQIATDKQDSAGLASGYNHIGLIHFDLDEYINAISYFQKALTLNENIHDESQEVYLLMRIAYAYSKNNQLDSASTYMQKAINKWRKLKLSDSFNGLFFELIGEIQFAVNNRSLGFDYLKKSILINQKNNFLLTGAIAHIVIAGFYKESGQVDSAISHAKQGLVEAKIYGVRKRVLEASSLLAELYESKNLEEALYYRKVYDSANEELYGRRKVQDLQKILSDEQERQRENELQKIAYENKIRQYSLLAGLGVFLIIAFLLYRNNRHKQKANIVLQQQKEKVEITLQELKSTQAQLIQSEKMASLGELTAGIAHEIQNPLNFVNNFSEVNKELLIEMNDELDKGNMSEARAISKEITDNEEKIMHHGKRADAIVKGMLQHSRTSTGVKELTDINALADEYLRLSYHGMRAKDKSFNAILKTDFDSGIGKINAVPQDIGRVLLNLFNNAFYSVMEKKKVVGESYEPAVTVCTKKLDGSVEIHVKDNGVGIPQKVVDKIFQPFFTTKPTGQGTGLGLSLSYDIVKAHGGEIKVETTEGDGVEFTIQLHLS